ncbi:hypothetical protein [Clostridium beijerinckii]|uniref:hypothetical protein n=1 Tax=Clostridium beijerinckii TaxID=1520 RepID=UPI00080A2260|nr:hypothetical protein [Clostridium beijerinckii]OCA97888.1 hypothetical protein BGS1_02355 [Clostridium beijerinckii]
MKKIYGFREFQKVKRKEEYLLNVLRKEKFDNFIDIMKSSGVLLNSFSGSNKYEKFINEVDLYIRNEKTNIEIEKWELVRYTAELLSKMSKKVYLSEEFKKAQQINKDDELNLILVTIEIILRYIKNLMVGNPKGNREIEKHFSIKHMLKLNECKEEYLQWGIMYENIVECGNVLLKDLLFFRRENEYSMIYEDKKYNIECIEHTMNHFTSVDKYNFLRNICEEFKFSNLTAQKSSEDNVINFTNNDEFKESFEIYMQRRKTQASQHEAEIISYLPEIKKKVKINKYASGMPPNFFVDEEEIFCFISLVELLFTDDLNVFGKVTEGENKNLKINILDFMRAHSVLARICKTKIEKSGLTKDEWSVADNCIVLKPQELKRKLRENGIKSEEHDDIIKLLTFKKKKDLYDCPLIQVGEKYIMSPSLSSYNHRHLPILSRFNHFEFQGKAMENKLIDYCRKANMKAISKKIRKDNEEYQCDLIFVVENDVYICECKAWGDTGTIRGYYELFEKKVDACDQLDRISNFYSNNFELCLRDLELPSDWRPKSINNILIISNMIGDVEKINGTIIIDYSSFVKFLKRDKAKLKIGKESREIIDGLEVFDGVITASKMEKFLNSDVPIRLQKARVKEVKEVINLFGEKIKVSIFDEVLSNYYISLDINDDATKKYIESVSNTFSKSSC